MAADLTKVAILSRREIEARIIGPILQAFAEKMGLEDTLSVLRPVIRDLARQSGVQLANRLGGNSIAHFMEGMKSWTMDDALQTVILEQTDRVLYKNIVRCSYAEMYKELGMTGLGKELSCGRDYAMCEGFNPKLKLTRTQTIMEGAPFCDFRYRLED